MSVEIHRITIERVGPNDNMRPVAELAKLVFTTTYEGVQDPVTGLPITREELEYHTSGDWVGSKAAEFTAEVRNQGAQMAIALAAEGVVAYRLRRWERIGGGYYVHPEYQGKGLGKRLWLALPETVGQRDLYITVVPGTQAVDFYINRLGFHPTGRDLSGEYPKLRGGQTLPQMELVLPAEAEVESVRKLWRRQ